MNPREKNKDSHTKRYTKTYPGEEVQMDATEPFGKSRGIQISAVDDYSRWGGADFYMRNTSLNAAIFLTRYIQNAPFSVRAVRVDNGSEFKGVFQATCQKLGIAIIRNRVNTPEHNGKVERFHRTIDEECLWRTKGESEYPEEVMFQLDRYLAWYNTRRRHGGFGMNKTTPQEKIEDFIIQNNAHPFTVDVNETLILYISVLVHIHTVHIEVYEGYNRYFYEIQRLYHPATEVYQSYFPSHDYRGSKTTIGLDGLLSQDR